MKSECFEKEQLMAYATKLLEPDEETKVHAHLVAGCETCNAVVTQYLALDSVLEEWKPAQPSPWFDARLRAAIRSGRAPKEAVGFLGFDRASWSRWLTPVLAAALVAVVAVVGVRVHHSNRASSAIVQTTGQGATQAANPPGQDSIGTPGHATEEAGAVDAKQAAEDDDMLTNFDVLSELPAPQSSDKIEN